jgi:uncharacterized protein (TIGR02271 family)
MAKISVEQLASMRGKPVVASDGDKVGNVETIFSDAATGEPEWIEIGSGFFGMKRVLVPVEGAQVKDGQEILVPYSKDQVKDTPSIDSDEVPEETELELYAHYGLQPTEQRSETQLPGGTQLPGQTRGMQTPGETSVTRHEEELHVGKRETERGRVRLRKWVETEPVSEDVTLRRETAQVERVAVDRPAPGAQIGEQEVELTLHEEEPVVSKETVERERVSLNREEETEAETVRGEVRKEHVDVEGDVEETEEDGRR